MKNVLLLVHADSGQEARFQAALDLTRALGGHLTCVDVFVPQVMADDYYMGSGSAWAMAEEHDAERRHGAHYRERLATEDVAWDWVDATGGLGARIEDEAGLADVIVTSREADRLFEPNLQRVTEDVVLRRNQPVVAVPGDCTSIDWHGRALIAWDGSDPAMAALRSATPMLALAADVELFEVDDRLAGPSAEEAARYLSRHGVPSTIERVHSLHRATAGLIEDRADATGAAYVVMGAYGHNRVRELFLGGVTHRMVRGSRHPLVLAH
ncbi:MAG: universal stress protein [Chloroflexi bacterium]|nr:universal stress protein [Chloroflexota bacterium]